MESLQDAYVQLEKRHAELQRLYDILNATSRETSQLLNENGTEAARFVPRLISIVSSLYRKDLYSDMTIGVDGHQFPGHRLVIASHTNHWGNLAGVSNVELEGIGLCAAESILKWMYTGEIDQTICDSAVLEMLGAALKYEIDFLANRSEALLVGRINIDNCIRIYQFADESDLSSLRDCCAEFVASKWTEFRPEHFDGMSAPLLYEMLKRRSKHLLHSILTLRREDVLELYISRNEPNLGTLLNSPDDDGLFPLDLLLRSAQLGTCTRLIKHGADVDKLDSAGKSFLWKAIERSDSNACMFLLETAECSLACTDEESGDTILHLVARRMYDELTEWISSIVTRADVNAVNKNGRTALMVAIEYGNRRLVALLLEQEATDANSCDHQGTSPIELSLLEKRDVEMARLLVEKGKIDLNQSDSEGRTLWHKAIMRADLATVQFLAEQKANVNGQNEKGATPLHLLMEAMPVHGLATGLQMDMLKLLLKSGADVSIKDNTSGSTPIHLGVTRNKAVLETILSLIHGNPPLSAIDDEGRSPLWCALMAGKLDVAKRLVEAGADVNEAGNDSPPLLIRAITMKRDDLARFLLDAGANANVGSIGQLHNNYNSLNLSVESGLTATVNYLCKLGANPNIPCNTTGLVPLWTALEKSDYGTAEVLVNHGCDVEGWALMSEGSDLEETLLHRAIASENSRAAVFLIRSGCNVNAQRRPLVDSVHHFDLNLQAVNGGKSEPTSDFTKDTPLHMSVKLGQTEVTKSLLSNLNCKVAAHNGDIKTAAHIAVEKQDMTTVELLLSHPNTSAFNLQDRDGKTPLTLAICNGNDKLASAIYLRLPNVPMQINEHGENILHEAVKKADLESVLFLLALHIDVNIPCQNKTKNAALHLCAEGGNDLIMRNLILAGAEVDQTNSYGQTALHTAAGAGCVELCKILLENGADVNVADGDGNSALHLAVISGASDVVQFLLLESSVNYMAVNKTRQNILHLCANATGIVSAEVFLTILEIHPSYPLESTDMYGNTAFLLAFLKENTELCKLALRNGCCMGVVNHQGQSAFNIVTPTKQLLFGLLDGLDREPLWAEGDECSECGTRFTLTMRKHHCRHCGRLVCAKCSDHQIPILKFDNGTQAHSKPVRVCQICLDVLTGVAPSASAIQ